MRHPLSQQIVLFQRIHTSIDRTYYGVLVLLLLVDIHVIRVQIRQVVNEARARTGAVQRASDIALDSNFLIRNRISVDIFQHAHVAYFCRIVLECLCLVLTYPVTH